MQILKVGKVGGMPKQQQNERWSRPPPEILNINTDGAFLKETKNGGWGFVIKDDCGMLMATGAGSLERVSDALHSDTLAMLYAINTAIQMGCN